MSKARAGDCRGDMDGRDDEPGGGLGEAVEEGGGSFPREST